MMKRFTVNFSTAIRRAILAERLLILAGISYRRKALPKFGLLLLSLALLLQFVCSLLRARAAPGFAS